MGLLSINRIKSLREALEAESISYGEGAEIDEAFAKIPDANLRDLRENALYGDMLDELEGFITPLEQAIYDWVSSNFGGSEANDPSWDIGELANYLERGFTFSKRG